jgi:acyl-CoA hydrolase
LEQEEWTLTTHCVIVFVALDKSGKPRKVPTWLPLTKEDERLHTYAGRLMELRESIDREMQPFIRKDADDGA